MSTEDKVTAIFLVVMFVGLIIVPIGIMFGKDLLKWLTKPFRPKPNLKSGQKVRVRADLEHAKDYGDKKTSRRVYYAMMKHVGCIVTVGQVSEDGERCHIEEDDEDTWHYTMFTKVSYDSDEALFEALLNREINEEQYEEIRRGRG